MLELDDSLMEPFATDGVIVPLIRLTSEPEPPDSQLMLGDVEYRYDRSYPVKGQSAVMPGYLREQLAAGKKALLIERPERFYVYFAA
ncbi:MAG: hypothetical protein GEU75_15765 [Dehalococcoidia bacterium]|nr:hypothetical protein [Dehalococcoidia bacterium]